MSSAPALKIIEGGRIADRTAPSLPAVHDSERLYPVFDAGGRGAFFHVIAVSLILHGAVVAAAIGWNLFGEERAIGGSEEAIVIEGIEIVLLDQMPNAPSPLVEAQAIETPDIAEPVEEAETAAPTEEFATGASPLPGEALPIAPDSAMEVPAETAPRADEAVEAARYTSVPVESARTDTTIEIVDDRAGEVREDQLPEPQIARAIPPIETAPTTDAPDAATPQAEADIALVPDADAAKAIEDVPPEAPSKTAETAAIVDDSVAPKPIDETRAAAAVDLVDEAPVPPKRPADVEPAKPAPAKSKSASKPNPSAASSKSDVAARGPTKAKAGAGGKTKEARGTVSLSTYQSRLVAHLRRYRTYPSTARSKRLQGTAVVSFTIDKNGRVVGSSLAKGTGHQILDREAVAMVRRASPFPAMPAGIGKSRLTVRAPIRFDMR
jgi:protein TonB